MTHLKSPECENETGDYHQGHLARDCYWPTPTDSTKGVKMTNAWYIQDTRGYLDAGPSCSECGACECEPDKCDCLIVSTRPHNHHEDCQNIDVMDEATENCVGLSYVYCNPDDGAENLCEPCAMKAGITLQS